MRYILYIIFVAAITMFLVYVGYIKERNLPVELTNRLYKKCSNKVLKYLNTHKTISPSQVRNLISDVTASVIWSKKHVWVTNSIQFSRYIIEVLLKDAKIEETTNDNKKVYILKNSK